MKMKEIGPKEGGKLVYGPLTLRSANERHHQKVLIKSIEILKKNPDALKTCNHIEFAQISYSFTSLLSLVC